MLLTERAGQARGGRGRPEETGHQLQIVPMGPIVSASRGDQEAASRVRPLTELLLESSR